MGQLSLRGGENVQRSMFIVHHSELTADSCRFRRTPNEQRRTFAGTTQETI